MTLQQEIIQALGAKPQIDVAGEIRRSVDFLKSYLQTYPFIKSLVLGISGGQDSTLTGKLCQIAINELRAETGDSSLQFIAVRLPYGVQADEQDCQDAIAFIQPDRVLTVNIKAAVLASEQALREAGIELSDFVRGNEKARERMKAQYSIAGMTKGVVVGTDPCGGSDYRLFHQIWRRRHRHQPNFPPEQTSGQTAAGPSRLPGTSV